MPKSGGSATVAGSRQTGVSSARQLEIRPISVTLANLARSLFYTGAPRAATPLGGWTAPALDPETGREIEGERFQQACNRLATS
jgi:hypothetical protein